jgi:hypothetical protein
MRIEPVIKLTGLQIQDGKTLEVEAVDAPRHETRNGDWEWVHVCSLLCERHSKRNNDLDADVNSESKEQQRRYRPTYLDPKGLPG